MDELERAICTCGSASFLMFWEYYGGIAAAQSLQTRLSAGSAIEASRITSSIESLGSVTSIIVVPYLGDVVESLGRKPVLVAGPVAAGLGRLAMALHPSWLTYGANKVVSGTALSSTQLACETTFNDLTTGPSLSEALSRYRVFMGAAMVASAPIGARIFQWYGEGVSHTVSAISVIIGAVALATVHKETKGVAESKNKGKKTRKSAKSSPVSFLLLFNDPTLARLAAINSLQLMCDYMFEFDGIFLRNDVKLSPSELGWWYSLRGASYFTGAAFASYLKPLLGPLGYTTCVNCTVFIYLLRKATAQSFSHIFF